jgi:hypothetical protein
LGSCNSPVPPSSTSSPGSPSNTSRCVHEVRRRNGRLARSGMEVNDPAIGVGALGVGKLGKPLGNHDIYGWISGSKCWYLLVYPKIPLEKVMMFIDDVP